MRVCPVRFMLHGLWRERHLGSGVDGWTYGDQLRAGKITGREGSQIEAGRARTVGTCNTMGTASTMAAIAEAPGLVLPMASSLATAVGEDFASDPPSRKLTMP